VKKIKVPKSIPKKSHTSNSKFLSGNYGGTAIKNKIGKIRDMYPIEGPSLSKNKGKPPKSLA
jgi:hypothetical protein